MRHIKLLLLVIIFVSLCGMHLQVQAMEMNGFETEEMTIEEIELFLDNVNILMIDIEPSKEPVKCFDVNMQGMVAIGTEDGIDKTICIYSENGDFQYGYSFKSEGSFGLEFNDEVLQIYFVRSDVSVSIDSTGEIQNVLKIRDTSNNNTYWNQVVRATSRNEGQYQYELKNDIGILGVFTSTYSQLCRIDKLANECIIYDAGSFQFFKVLVIFVGIIVFVFIVAMVLIREFKRLYKEGSVVN